MKSTWRTACLVVAVCTAWLAHAGAGTLGTSLARRYDQNTYLAAHNAFAHGELYYPVTANQIPGITAQLNSGVRCLLLDLWFMRQRVVNDVLGLPDHVEAEIYEQRNAYLQPTPPFAGASASVVLAHEPKSEIAGYKLLLGYPLVLMAYQFLSEPLDELKEWMDNHPDEVVTLVLESYVPEPNEIDGYLISAGLGNMTFSPHLPNAGMFASDGQRWYVPFHGWPRLQDMVNAGKRLVIFSSNGTQWSRYSGQPVGAPSSTNHDGQAYQWDFMVENQYGQSGIDGGGDQARSSSRPLDDMLHPLSFMNWFPDFPEQNYVATLNSYPALGTARDNFERAANRSPTFVAVDHILQGGGGPHLIVFECNTHWARRDNVTADLTVLPEPNAYGWRTSAVVTATGSSSGGVVDKINYYWHGGAGVLGFGEEIATGPNGVQLGPHNDWTGDPFIATRNDGVFHVSAEAVTAAGDRSYRELMTIQVDQTPPIVGPAVTRPPDTASGWYNHPLTLSVTVRDLLSGAASVWWTNASGQVAVSETFVTVPHPQQISRVFEFSYEQEGSGFVQFFSRDFAGNNSFGYGFGIFFPTNILAMPIQLDMKPPVTRVAVTSIADGTAITLLPYDTLSGVAGTWFRLDGGAWIAYTAALDILGTNAHTLEFYSRDVADNQEPTRTFFLNRAAVSLTSAHNPSHHFRLLEFTAQVVVSGFAPTGMVTFLDGINVMGQASVGTNGVARLTNSPINYVLGLGVHSITARYDGGALFGTTTSLVLTQRVGLPPQVRLTVSSNRVVETQPIVLTAEVIPEDGFLATGTITFEIDRTSTGQTWVKTAVSLDANGCATYSTAQLPPGDYLLFASYSGDNNVPPAPQGSAVTLTVVPGEMFVSMTSSPPDTSVVGEPVTFTITVNRTPGAPPALNTSVRVQDFDEVLQTLTLGSSNSASFTTSSLGVGEHFLLLTADSVPQLSGGVASYVYVVVDAPAVAPYFRKLSKDTAGPAGLQIDVQPGRGVLVEYSTNLSSWYQLGIGTNTGDLFQFTDFEATNGASRFYRAQMLTP